MAITSGSPSSTLTMSLVSAKAKDVAAAAQPASATAQMVDGFGARTSPGSATNGVAARTPVLTPFFLGQPKDTPHWLGLQAIRPIKKPSISPYFADGRPITAHARAL